MICKEMKPFMNFTLLHGCNRVVLAHVLFGSIFHQLTFMFVSNQFFLQNYTFPDQNCTNDLKRFITICCTKPRCNWKGPLLQIEVCVWLAILYLCIYTMIFRFVVKRSHTCSVLCCDCMAI